MAMAMNLWPVPASRSRVLVGVVQAITGARSEPRDLANEADLANELDETPLPREEQLAVLFADVSGSTQMYETLGDVRARAIVARCVADMTAATRRHGGALIKTIGDEVMTTFPNAADAAEAACEMQETITGQMVEGRPLAIRIGFHFGPVLSEETDVFGDAVNLAARLANEAKPVRS